MCEINNFDKRNVMAEIVGASALLYPVLADFGTVMEAPVLVYVEGTSGFQAFLNSIQCFGLPPVHSLGEAPTVFRKGFEQENLGVIVIKYTHSRYSLQNLEELVQYCNSILDSEARSLVFVVTDQFVPGSFLPYFAGTIYFSALRDCCNLLERSEFLKILADTVVINQIQLQTETKEIVNKDLDGIALFSVAAVCIERALPTYGCAKEVVEKFGEAATLILEEIREHWVPSSDSGAYVEAFAQRLFEEIISGISVPTILDHYHVLAKDCSEIDSANYYDDEAYYFNMDFFERVCAPLAEQVGKEFLKQQLVSAGLLESGNGKRNYFTSKVEVVTEYGFVERVRRIKIYRRELEKDDDISFVDLIMLRKEEDEDEAKGNLLDENAWAE